MTHLSDVLLDPALVIEMAFELTVGIVSMLYCT